MKINVLRRHQGDFRNFCERHGARLLEGKGSTASLRCICRLMTQSGHGDCSEQTIATIGRRVELPSYLNAIGLRSTYC